jgi:hypothetical protein
VKTPPSIRTASTRDTVRNNEQNTETTTTARATATATATIATIATFYLEIELVGLWINNETPKFSLNVHQWIRTCLDELIAKPGGHGAERAQRVGGL